MANQIPLSGSSDEAGGHLLPSPLVETVVEQIQRESGALNLVNVGTSTSRKQTIPIFKGRPQAQFVEEGAAKPVDGAEFGSTQLNIKKQAIIVPFSMEVLEDAQDDPRVLVTNDVIGAFADLADAHIVGMAAGSTISSSYDSDLVDSAGDSVELGTDGDNLRKAVSAALGVLEGNGYGSADSVLWAGDAAQQIRDARSQDDNTVAVYNGADPNYGLNSALSTNLAKISDAEEGDVVGVVFDSSHALYRVRTDLALAVSDQAAYTQDGELVSSFERNTVLLRWELRSGFVITDPRAVVTITKGATGS